MGKPRTGGLAAFLCMLVAAAPSGAVSRRKECATACPPAIAVCTSACGDFGVLEASCRRAVLKGCRREGAAYCVARAVTTTSYTVTTTTRPTTTTTTLVPGDSCVTPLPLVVGTTVTGDTSAYTDSGGGFCAQASTPDVVYAISIMEAGTLFVTLSSAWDGVLYFRGTCDDPDTEFACANNQPAGVDEVLAIGVDASSTYYVYVDGAQDGDFGSFTLNAQVQ